mmetsp:Transcript_52287/g.152230  ORF Transcript_52287/g.152230 Transcript_52287/m.152230 type:complete len:124 (-) Transcript_52287:156-527(-)
MVKLVLFLLLFHLFLFHHFLLFVLLMVFLVLLFLVIIPYPKASNFLGNFFNFLFFFVLFSLGDVVIIIVISGQSRSTPKKTSGHIKVCILFDLITTCCLPLLLTIVLFLADIFLDGVNDFDIL